MTFLFQSLLTIGLPLVAIPLLIHLINMRRHQPVRWAAMDFLLESQKRNKKWILLRQFLLLALRTTAILLAVVMLAGPVLMSQWGSLLGSGVTHHVLLVDDSYSMSDQWEDVSAWNQAKRAVSAILDQATSAVGTQKLTLLRFSQTAQLSAGVEVPISNRSLDRKVAEEVDALLENQPVTETAVGPIEVFQAALSLPRADSEEALVVYVVSDFRARQWSENPQARQLLSELRTNSADLHLIQCVEQSRPNLAITRLEPESGIRSAGVEMWMQLSVMNYGDQLVDSVPVEVFQDGQKLPAVTFDKVGPGEEVTRRFRVALPTAGAHELVAQLPGDPVAADNRRFFACDVPNSFPLLVIDGSPQGEESFYLSTALNPTGTSKPGWSPQVEPVNFLRQHAELPKFAAIFLLDVPRLDDADVTALEEYVRQGGGLAIFLGPEIQRSFYSEQLYRDGTGLMPLEIDVPTQLLSPAEEATADVVVEDHPVFRVFAGQRNNFLSIAQVNFYYSALPPRENSESEIQILARLSNGAPFVVEKKFGSGRVIAQLCRLSPKNSALGVWSNWSLNPVFPVVANELAGYLTAAQRRFDELQVGGELRFDLAEDAFEPEVIVRSPGKETTAGLSLTPQASEGRYVVNAGRGNVSGVWQFGLKPRQDGPAHKFVAVNVAPEEGDLHHLDQSALATQLKGIDYHFSLASQMTATKDQLAGYRLGDSMLLLLLAVLVGEQWLAYKASYHGRAGGGRA